MNVVDAIAAARRLHHHILTDTLIIDRPDTTTIGDLGQEIQQWRTIHDRIPGLVQQQTPLQPYTGDSAGEPIRVVDHICKVDVDIDIQSGDRITVITSLDARNLGTWYVGDVERQGWAITRRVHVTRTWHSPSTPHS